MSRRSLTEQLDDAVQAVMAGGDAGVSGSVEIASLARLAAKLRNLPRQEFKKRLRNDLQRRAAMATATEPISRRQTVASPRLTFKNAAKAIDFYAQALGAKETFRFDTPGGIAHAEIMIGDSLVMLAEEWPEGGRFSAETLGQSPVSLSLNVADVDTVTAHALAAGMKVAIPIQDQFYGHRDATLVDPFGYSWHIFTVKEEIKVEEMHRRMHAMMPEEPKRPAVSPVPKGYRTVTPYLVARDGPGLVEFTKKAFGGEELFRTVGSAGGLHAEVRIGDSMLMMGGGLPGREFRSTPNTHALHVYVRDVDAVYAQALAAGGTSIGEVRDQEYGERSGGVKDAAGNYWYIATHLGKSYVPEPLHDVSVYMHPLRAEPLINFLKRAFGAREIGKYASPDGVVHHAQVQLGSSVVEMGEAHGQYEPMQSMFYLYVPDCDGMYRRALAAGATSISEPADQNYGDRTAAIKDVFGNQWYLATRVKEVS